MLLRVVQKKDAHSPGPMIVSADIVFPVAGRPVERGAVMVKDGAVAEVGPLDLVASRHPEATVRRFDGAAVLPGLVNLHSHLEFTSLGPLLAPRAFLPWLEDLVARSRGMSEGDWESSARDGAKIAVASGITAVADITRTGAGFRAMKEAGLRGTAALEWVAVGDDRIEEEWTRFEGAFAGLLDRQRPEGVSLGISPHAPYTLSRRALQRAAAFARGRSLRILTHAAETAEEVALVQGRNGPMAPIFGPLFGLDFAVRPEATPVSYLQEVGLLSDSTLLAHGVHLLGDDFRRLAAAGASLALCPTSNAMLQVGRPPEPSGLDKAGVRWGLGTDSLASVPAIDLIGEARAILEFWPSTDADRLLRAMTLDAAGILGLERTGALVPGWSADMAVIRVARGVSDAAGLIRTSAGAVQVYIGGRERLPESDQVTDVGTPEAGNSRQPHPSSPHKSQRKS